MGAQQSTSGGRDGSTRSSGPRGVIAVSERPGSGSSSRSSAYLTDSPTNREEDVKAPAGLGEEGYEEPRVTKAPSSASLGILRKGSSMKRNKVAVLQGDSPLPVVSSPPERPVPAAAWD
eukprot:RCo027151